MATVKLPDSPSQSVKSEGWVVMEGRGFTVTTQLPVDCVNVVLHVPSFVQRVYVVVVVNPVGGS